MRGVWRCVALTLVLAGCASPNPNLYTLTVQPGAARAPGPALVIVRNVGIPRYMEREEIVRSAASDRLVVASNDWWGEPLPAMIRRVLAEDLTQRLPGSNVLAGESVIGLQPDAEIEVTLERFDRDASGVITLAGYAAIQRKGAPQDLVRLDAVVPDGGTAVGDEVKAMGEALGQVADEVAQRLMK